MGDDFVYWSDYSHKKLWFLRKDGSSKRPLSLGTFRDPVMSVVVFRNQPVNCCPVSSPETCQPRQHELAVKNQPVVIHRESTSSGYDDVDICTGFCYHNGECVVLLNSDLHCRYSVIAILKTNLIYFNQSIVYCVTTLTDAQLDSVVIDVNFSTDNQSIGRITQK